LAVPPTLFAILFYNRNSWAEKSFQDLFGTLLEGIDVEKNGKWISATVLLIFFMRRLAIVVSMVVLEDFLWG